MNQKEKKKHLSLAKWFRCIFLAGGAILLAYFGFIIRYARRTDKVRLEKRYGKLRVLCIRILRAFHVNLIVERAKELQNIDRPILFVGNHQSLLDMVSLIALSKKPLAFVAKKSVAKLPFAGKATKSIGCFYLDREDPKQAIRLYRDAAKMMKEEGRSYALYAEGTRNKKPFEEVLLPFHDGAFKLQQWGNSDLIYVATFGSFRPLQKYGNDKSFPIHIAFSHIRRREALEGKTTADLARDSHDYLYDKILTLQEKDRIYYENGENRKKPSSLLKELLKDAKSNLKKRK